MKEKIIKTGLYIVIFLPVLGELIRLPFGPGNGLLISDLIIPVVIALGIVLNIRREDANSAHSDSLPPDINSADKNRPASYAGPSASPLTLPIILFSVAAALSLLGSLLFLDTSEVASGSLYFIRWIFYALLYFTVICAVKTEKDFKYMVAALAASASLLALLGFIQLAVYPDLEALEEEGWDPHINRLVSTWLDPNFVGGLLAFIISILTGLALHVKKHKPLLIITILFLSTAAFLTYSRSAWLALAAGLIVISLIKSRKLLIIGLILATIGLAASDRARERAGELVQSVTSVFTETAQTPDPTARLRIKSYNQTLQIIEKYPILGVGYNNLRAVNHREGFVASTEIHNAGGSDSSLLTILATTGIIGFIPFCLIYLIALRETWLNYRQKHGNTAAKYRPPPETPDFSSLRAGFALGLFGGIIALLIHSLFVNSLLYSHILIYFWTALGLNSNLTFTFKLPAVTGTGRRTAPN